VSRLSELFLATFADFDMRLLSSTVFFLGKAFVPPVRIHDEKLIQKLSPLTYSYRYSAILPQICNRFAWFGHPSSLGRLGHHRAQRRL